MFGETKEENKKKAKRQVRNKKKAGELNGLNLQEDRIDVVD